MLWIHKKFCNEKKQELNFSACFFCFLPPMGFNPLSNQYLSFLKVEYIPFLLDDDHFLSSCVLTALKCIV